MKTLSTESRWAQLITRKRLGQDEIEETPSYRSTFQKDYDRLIFSAAFRRLQDKTQVFPLAQTDYIRTRLTHSLEVSSVCRSLGTLLGEFLSQKYKSLGITPGSIGAILAAGALAHDIGNPPFGHAGEDAISRFFAESPIGQKALAEINPEKQNDFLYFEGNAQAFRLLTRLQNSHNYGGLQLSLPVIASFIKYPQGSSAIDNSALQKEHSLQHHVAFKKYNYFQAEKDIFKEFATEANLKPHLSLSDTWYRHPFAYLLEAADDICYGIVDIEDAYRLKLISAEKIYSFYGAIIHTNHSFPEKRLKEIPREKDRVEYLRAYTIGVLINEVIEVFKANEVAILNGEFPHALLSVIDSADALEKISTYSRQHIYVSPPVLEVGMAGFKVLETLLESFIEATYLEAHGRSNAKTKMIKSFLPDQFLNEKQQIEENPYLRYLQVTDFISGMTDRYAVYVYKTLTGVNLPG